MVFWFICVFCSVRTPISMKFFPRFFLLYFLVFHIYFFSYAYGMSIVILTLFLDGNVFFCDEKSYLHTVAGFSYLALSTAAAFMQHLILYFWNRFEVTFVMWLMSYICSLCVWADLSTNYILGFICFRETNSWKRFAEGKRSPSFWR